MRIGLFTDTFYPQINGVATSTFLLKIELEKLGHKVYLFTTSDPKVKEPSPSIFRLPSMPFIFLPTHRVAYMYSPRLLMNLKKLKLDIIHTQTEFPIGIFGKVVSDVFKLPHVHTYHTMYEDYVHYVAHGHLITPKMAKKFSRIFCNRSDAVIAPVEKTLQSLLGYGVHKPIHVIPTGLDFSDFSDERHPKAKVLSAKNDENISNDDPVVIYVGRIGKEKSLDVVIRSMVEVVKSIPNARLVIVGSGPLLEEYVLLSKTLGICENVLFLGAKPWTEIGKYYKMGSVFATASTSETQGLTYIEAMASGVCVIAKEDGSMEGYLKHGETGYIFKHDDELSEIIICALKNPDKTMEIAQNGAKSIQDLSSNIFGRNVEQLYKDVMENSKNKQKKFKLKFSRKSRTL